MEFENEVALAKQREVSSHSHGEDKGKVSQWDFAVLCTMLHDLCCISSAVREADWNK